MPLSSTTTGPRLVVATLTLASVAGAPAVVDEAAAVVVVLEAAVLVSAFFELLHARAMIATPATRASVASRRRRESREVWFGVVMAWSPRVAPSARGRPWSRGGTSRRPDRFDLSGTSTTRASSDAIPGAGSARWGGRGDVKVRPITVMA